MKRRVSIGKRAAAVVVLCALGALGSPAHTLTTLASFDGTNGQCPEGSLVQATDGNFYGATIGGGANGNHGTIFQITSSGTLTTLYSFCSQAGCTDGSGPSPLIQATDGNLYGTTSRRGAHDSGTVFRITPSGTLTTLYSFCSQANCGDGHEPVGTLIQATDGNLYGATRQGGAFCIVATGCGTVFQITLSGMLTTLYQFCSVTCGSYIPEAGLAQATNGDLYGTTQNGGDHYNFGTLYKLTLSGEYTLLYSFLGPFGTDGEFPLTSPVQAANGDLYGTTNSRQSGTIFKFAAGVLTTLYAFCSQPNCTDGSGPSTLVQAPNGDLYGTTSSGGKRGPLDVGTLFKITTSGTLTTLYNFCSQPNCADGGHPGGATFAGHDGALLYATNGDIYGATCAGGVNKHGTIFRYR